MCIINCLLVWFLPSMGEGILTSSNSLYLPPPLVSFYDLTTILHVSVIFRSTCSLSTTAKMRLRHPDNNGNSYGNRMTTGLQGYGLFVTRDYMASNKSFAMPSITDCGNTLRLFKRCCFLHEFRFFLILSLFIIELHGYKR